MQMSLKRECAYEYIRAISCIFVVILHVSSMYVDDTFVGIVTHNDYLVASFWRVITDMGVPCFVMLSGAFLIKDKNADFSSFYNRSLKKIVNITFIFSILYVLFHYAENIVASVMGITLESGKIDYIKPIIDWFKGQPHVTMWYMYMIIPLYIIVPVIVLIKKNITRKSWNILSFVMLIYSIVVSFTCHLSWILEFAKFLGYFFMGNVIKEIGTEIKDKYINGKWFYSLGCGLSSFCLMAIYWYFFVYKVGELKIIGTNIILVLANLLIFTAFSILPVKKNNVLIEMLAKYSLWIYLIHPMFTEVLSQVCGRIIKAFPSAIGIPIYALIIVVLCIFLCKIAENFIIVFGKKNKCLRNAVDY